MSWLKNYPRNYYQKYERVKVKNDCGWYEVYRLPGNVYAIAEPQHFQEVNLYLILGTEKALLLDTGEGFCPIKPLIDELWHGEIIAFNSHFHFDHIGYNYLYEPLHVIDDPYVKAVSESGLAKESLGAQIEEEMFQFGYPKTMDYANFSIKPYEIEIVQDGDIFDLGNRSIRIYHTPGHSNDSLMLYDEVNKILFTGDTFYPGALYTHFDCKEFGHSDIDEYIKSMDRMIAEMPESVNLYCSHNEFIMPITKLKETADALRVIKDFKASNTSRGNVAIGHTYLEDGNLIAEYPCDNFSIIYKLDK